MDALRKQASKLREQVAKQQQVTYFPIFTSFSVVSLCFLYFIWLSQFVIQSNQDSSNMQFLLKFDKDSLLVNIKRDC